MSPAHLLTKPPAAEQIVSWAIETYKDRLAVVTSFQYEGMVIVDMAARVSKDVRVVTLDTGRLPAETFDMIEAVGRKYGVAVEVVSPDPAELESMVARHGPNLFYESVPLRTACCHFRKVRPLQSKLDGFDAWLTGLRRSQSDTRESLATFAQENGRTKISPLADWSPRRRRRVHSQARCSASSALREGIHEHRLRSMQPRDGTGRGRARGRWWWETGVAKECGLHFTPDGRAMRTVDVLIREILE